MPPIVLVVIQAAFLLLLYLFIARVARAILRDVRDASPAQPMPVYQQAPQPAPAPAPQPAAAQVTPSRSRAGSSEARGVPRELVVHNLDGRPRVIPLDSTEVRFGRDASATVSLSDPFVSEQHARVYRSSSGWVLADMGSTNGTFLNRSKVTAPVPVRPGDQIGIGKIVVEVRK